MFQSLKGMPDLLPTELGRWHEAENRLRDILTTFGYREIRTPYLEPTDLFARSIGTSTDVVEKEMYSMTDKDGSSVSLRPEGTASVVRAYLEHHLDHGSEITKLYYMGPMFRHERPQKGRLRQFHQVGAEILGTESPAADADLLILAMTMMETFLVTNPVLEINSVGDAACRPGYRQHLQTFLRGQASHLCENCKKRTETNPMRVFDCKSETCQKALEKAPLLSDHLCTGCQEHLSMVSKHLTQAGVPFVVNPKIVRGLDYYTRTAFEISAGGLGSQSAVLAGGRYDGLAEELGGKKTPAIGFAMGMERLLLSATRIEPQSHVRIEFIPITPQAEGVALTLATHLRKAALTQKKGIEIECTPTQSSLKGALRRASKSGANFVVLLGETELAQKIAQVKNLSLHAQTDVRFDDLTNYLLNDRTLLNGALEKHE